MADKKTIMIQLSAFRKYVTKGMKEVKRLYPEMVTFVEKNKEKSYDQLQKELLEQLKSYA